MSDVSGSCVYFATNLLLHKTARKLIIVAHAHLICLHSRYDFVHNNLHFLLKWKNPFKINHITFETSVSPSAGSHHLGLHLPNETDGAAPPFLEGDCSSEKWTASISTQASSPSSSAAAGWRKPLHEHPTGAPGGSSGKGPDCTSSWPKQVNGIISAILGGGANLF